MVPSPGPKRGGSKIRVVRDAKRHTLKNARKADLDQFLIERCRALQVVTLPLLPPSSCDAVVSVVLVKGCVFLLVVAIVGIIFQMAAVAKQAAFLSNSVCIRSERLIARGSFVKSGNFRHVFMLTMPACFRGTG